MSLQAQKGKLKLLQVKKCCQSWQRIINFLCSFKGGFGESKIY